MHRQLATIAVVIASTVGVAQALDRGEVIQGPARVVDGDTVEVAGIRVRLNGVAAPEIRESGGREAAEALRIIIGDDPVRCALSGDRSYDREVGVCWIGTDDVGALIISTGWARDCPRYSGGRYAAIERPEAKALPLPRYCR